MKALWREPLVHFLGLGLLLFLGHMLWQKAIERQDYTIHVSTAELERQALIFAGENRREPTDSDLKALLFSHIEEEVLMREAERLSLDVDDTIIRRRLAQKMRFLIEDVDLPSLPEATALRAWFDDNQTRFITPETRSFSHVFLSPETRGEDIEAVAEALLASLNDSADQAEDWEKMGDPFIMKRIFNMVDKVEVRRVFGSDFAQELFALEASATSFSQPWQGPIGSAFGLHLVRLEAVSPQIIPAFEDVSQQVGAAWQEETRRAQNAERMREIIARYRVNVEVLTP